MSAGTLRGLGTLLVLLAFAGLFLWVFSPGHKARFDEAAQLPFDDDEQAPRP